MTRKVYFIEQNNSNEFPENAIEFTDDTLQLMKVDSGNLNFQQQHTVNREATHDLAHLVKALKTVQILKDTYQIIMPLKEYLKGPEPFIQTLLALDLDDDLFDKFLGDFLCKFMLENDLEPDTIFLEAIQVSYSILPNHLILINLYHILEYRTIRRELLVENNSFALKKY